MATSKKFKAVSGLDNNANQIDNIGVTGAHLTRAGAHTLTLTTTATTNVTLPASGTLITGVGIIKNSGAVVGTRAKVNFIEGSNITLTIADDAGNGEVDVTIAATGSGTVGGSGTANEITYWTNSTTLGSLTTATYPSLTELSYVKGVTSAIQTQINAKFTLPSLTSGSVLFSNGTTIAQDNANFFWDDTNNRLGIGTATPATALHVIKDSGPQARIGHNASIYLTAGVDDAGALTFNGTGINYTEFNSVGTVNFSGAVNISGDLTVSGTTTTVNSTVVTIDDPIFTLGGDTAPGADDNKDRGIEFKWHNGTAAKVGFFGLDDSTGKFTFIPDATNTSEVFSGALGTIDVGAVHISGSQIAASNLSNGTTGSGQIVLATGPTLTNPGVNTSGSGTVASPTTNSISFGFSGIFNYQFDVSSISQQTITMMPKTKGRALKIVVSAVDATGSKFQTTEFLAVRDNSATPSVFMVEYGSVIGNATDTSNNAWTGIDVDCTTTDWRIKVTSASTNTTTYTVNAIALGS